MTSNYHANPEATLPPLPRLSETEVRCLRDQVYGQVSTECNWQYIRNNWMRPDSVRWLIEKSKRPFLI